MEKYAWRPGRNFVAKPEEAQKVFAHLQYTVGLTPEAVVNEARDEDSVLHRDFQWNDAVAGELYRLQEARKIIRAIVVVDPTGDVKEDVNVWMHTTNPEGDGVYERPSVIVLNKSDLPACGDTVNVVRSRTFAIFASCVDGAGIDRLREEIHTQLTTRAVKHRGLRFLFNLRQVNSLRSAAEALNRSSTARDVGREFVAAEIRTAVNHLRELTHPLDEEEILDRIFERFCIGK